MAYHHLVVSPASFRGEWLAILYAKMAAIMWMIFFPLLILLFVWILGKLIAYYKLCKAVRPVPGKPTHWFWGNVHEVNT